MDPEVTGSIPSQGTCEKANIDSLSLSLRPLPLSPKAMKKEMSSGEDKKNG